MPTLIFSDVLLKMVVRYELRFQCVSLHSIPAAFIVHSKDVAGSFNSIPMNKPLHDFSESFFVGGFFYKKISFKLPN